LAPILGRDCCTEKCLPIIEKMAVEQVFYVRKEAASALGSLASVLDVQTVVDKLVSIGSIKNQEIVHQTGHTFFRTDHVCCSFPCT
jgi:N-acetylglucosamine-6-phosphate deacetylase